MVRFSGAFIICCTIQFSIFTMQDLSDNTTCHYASFDKIREWIHETMTLSTLRSLDTPLDDLSLTRPLHWIESFLDSHRSLEHPHYLFLAYKLANKGALTSNTVTFICSHQKVNRMLFLEILSKQNLISQIKE